MSDFFVWVVLPVIMGGILFSTLWYYLSSYKYKDLPRAIAKGYSGSKYLLTRGEDHGTTDFYFDIDLSIANPSMLRPIIDWYVAVIERIKSEYGKIDGIAFMEKDSGPVGSILLAGTLIDKANVPGIIVRLRRRLHLNSLKGAGLKKGDQVILISDVLTSGGGIVNAVTKLRSHGLRVISAVVLVSRKEPDRVRELEEKHGIRVFYAFKATQKEDLQQEPVKTFIEKIKKGKKEGDIGIPLNTSISA